MCLFKFQMKEPCQELKIRRVGRLRFDEVFLFLQPNEVDLAIEK
ncbi:Uncharacterised protein [Chlamydia trachomatis]|nr:Uncharacterised protein [Chlamydia trachomatis]